MKTDTYVIGDKAWTPSNDWSSLLKVLKRVCEICIHAPCTCPARITAEFDEGTIVRGYTCRTCGGPDAVLAVAHPAHRSQHISALDCGTCGQQLAEFDAFTEEIVSFREGRWRA
jgi:hypothetical protein